MLFDERDLDKLFKPKSDLSREKEFFKARDDIKWWPAPRAEEYHPPTLKEIAKLSKTPTEEVSQDEVKGKKTIYVFVRPKRKLNPLTIAFFTLVLIYVVLNGPALFQNIRWWFITDYRNQNIVTIPKQAVAESDSIIIEKLGIAAPIIWGTTEENRDHAFKKGVAAVDETRPGDAGVVTLIGQASDYWWNNPEYGQVFALLGHMVIGDKIIVQSRGREYSYTVTNIRDTVPEEDFLTGGDTLMLVTSSPLGNTNRRLFIIARLDLANL